MQKTAPLQGAFLCGLNCFCSIVLPGSLPWGKRGMSPWRLRLSYCSVNALAEATSRASGVSQNHLWIPPLATSASSVQDSSGQAIGAEKLLGTPPELQQSVSW